MKKILKNYILITLVSFSVVILLQTLLFSFTGEQVTNKFIIQIFIICLLICAAISITQNIDLNTWIIDILSIFEIGSVIIIFNYISFKTINYINCIIIFVIGALVYFLVGAITYIQNSDDARKINDKLKR